MPKYKRKWSLSATAVGTIIGVILGFFIGYFGTNFVLEQQNASVSVIPDSIPETDKSFLTAAVPTATITTDDRLWGPLPSKWVCIEDRSNGSSFYRVAQAEYSWDAPTDLKIWHRYAGGCTGWQNHIRISFVTDTRMAELGCTGAACSRPVVGKPGRVDIAVNKSYMLTIPWSWRQHTIAHELGHAFGMWWHSTTAWSVMRVTWPPDAPIGPTWRDIAWANATY